MGTIDRTIRVIIAIVILILYFTKMIDGTLCLILLIIAAVFTLTSIVSFCPLYSIFRFSTCSRKKSKKK